MGALSGRSLTGLRPRRLVFLGSPEPAAAALRSVHDAGFDVALVVTQPDKRRGRGGALSPSPVKATALALGLPVSHRVDDVIDAGADLGVVVAFGKLVKPHVLAAVPMVNVHFSLLPRWRGAAPVERAILAGDAGTGVCLMVLEEGLDTGPVLGCVAVPITAETTADELRATLTEAGIDLLLAQLGAGLAPAVDQVGEPLYAAKIDPAELRLDWSRPAFELDRRVRAGRAWTTFRGHRLGVVRARRTDTGGAPGELAGAVVGTGEGGLELVEVRPEGKGTMSAAAWLNGIRPRSGERLGG